MFKDKYVNLGLILLILIYFKGNAQKNIETQQLLWMRYNLSLKFNENYKLRYELEERVYSSTWRQHQFLTKAHLERTVNENWIVGIGFTYLVQSLPHSPNLDVIDTQKELRPQIEIENKHKIFNKLIISNRYWTEFRFFEQSDASFEFSNVRARYKLELNYSLSKKITLKAFDEIHLNIGNKIVNNVFDQNRYGGSIQYRLLKDLGVELGCLNWFQQRQTGVDFFNRNIVRFTIHHNISLNN